MQLLSHSVFLYICIDLLSQQLNLHGHWHSMKQRSCRNHLQLSNKTKRVVQVKKFLFCFERVLLKKICHDYDQKHRLLMIENEQLRQCVVEIDQQFQRLLLIHRRPEEILSEINTEDESFETRSFSFCFWFRKIKCYSCRINEFTMWCCQWNCSTPFFEIIRSNWSMYIE